MLCELYKFLPKHVVNNMTEHTSVTVKEWFTLCRLTWY